MSTRLSFRPRPLDINKRLPIVKSIEELDSEPNVSRSIQHAHIALDAENEEVPAPTNKKAISEIPIPISHVVDSYCTDYPATFKQPPSYLRGRARTEASDYVEYDLDDEDDEWLQQFNNERNLVTAERFEWMLYRLELLDHKHRERMNGGPPAPGTNPIPPALSRDVAYETLRGQSARHAVLAAVYDYWRAKRERWGKPFFRRLQPPPSVNDTNPFNVFRPREKVHRPHTRRMQRRENDIQSFEKLRQVRRNLMEAKEIISALQKREEKKKEIAECESGIQKLQLRFRHDARGDDGGLFAGVTTSSDSLVPRRGGLRLDSAEASPRLGTSSGMAQDQANGLLFGSGEFKRPNDMPRLGPAALDVRPTDADDQIKLRSKKRRRKYLQPRGRGTLKRMVAMDELEPIFLFTRTLDQEALAAAGVVPPIPLGNGTTVDSFMRCQGRIGRGGRIVFDRWSTLGQRPICDQGSPPLTSERSLDPPPPRLSREAVANVSLATPTA